MSLIEEKLFRMINLTNSAIVLWVFLAFARADLCSDNVTIAEFPGGLPNEIAEIILTGIYNGYSGCGDRYPPVVDSDVKFMFFNRTYRGSPILLDPSNPFQVDSTKPVIVLIHGWTCSMTDGKMPEMVEAYLDRYDCNIIGVDWSSRSVALASEAYCSSPGIAKIVGRLLCTLNALKNIGLELLHLVGHSLGAHIAGLAGKDVKTRCNQVLGRITGLDPAGLIYHKVQASDRLNATDAEFVDVIHSNQGLLGYFGLCGDVDFFPNCGTLQPGCFQVTNLTTITEIASLPIMNAACNHFRSCDFWIESVRSGSTPFTARKCLNCPLEPCFNDILDPKSTVMGEDCPNPPPAPTFRLTTNAQSPYAQG